jgi:carbon monoxide dehydrogenase subunit G
MSSQRVVSGLRSEQFIHTDPEVAWQAWTEKAVLVQWFPGVSELTKISEGTIAAGSKVLITGAAEAEVEIIEFELGRVLTYRLLSRYAEFRPHRATVQIKPSLTGAEVAWVLQLDEKGGGFLGFRSPSKDANLVMTVALSKLKEFLESEAYSTPGFESDDRSKRWDDSI